MGGVPKNGGHKIPPFKRDEPSKAGEDAGQGKKKQKEKKNYGSQKLVSGRLRGKREEKKEIGLF